MHLITFLSFKVAMNSLCPNWLNLMLMWEKQQRITKYFPGGPGSNSDVNESESETESESDYDQSEGDKSQNFNDFHTMQIIKEKNNQGIRPINRLKSWSRQERQRRKR